MSASRTLLRRNPFNVKPIQQRERGVTEKKGQPSRRVTGDIRASGAAFKQAAKGSQFGEALIPARFVQGLVDRIQYDVGYHFTKGPRVRRA